jgi:uncharacterized UPF0146 family protein
MSNKGSAYAGESVVKAFDESSESFKTTLVNADVNINVDAFTDSVKIGDGTGNTATITEIGSKKAIDVNVVDISLNESSDSVKVFQDTHDNLNLNSNIQIGNTDVSNSNPVPTKIVQNVSNIYNEVLNVSNGIPTEILNTTLTFDKYLKLVSVSGTNIAMYELLIDNVVIAKSYTYYTNLNHNFLMERMNLSSGQNIKVIVTHARPNNGDFNANILLKDV